MKTILELAIDGAKKLGLEVTNEVLAKEVRDKIFKGGKAAVEKFRESSEEVALFRRKMYRIMDLMNPGRQATLTIFIRALSKKQEDSFTLAIGRYLDYEAGVAIDRGKKGEELDQHLAEVLNRISESEDSLRIGWQILTKDPVLRIREHLNDFNAWIDGHPTITNMNSRIEARIQANRDAERL